MAFGARKEQEVREIVKPRTDKRDYRRIVLHNALEVLLISYPETDKCAASMNVGVGSFSDPEGLEGLVHFLGLCSCYCLSCTIFGEERKFPEIEENHKEILKGGEKDLAFQMVWTYKPKM